MICKRSKNAWQWLKDTLEDIMFYVGCSVNTVTREYNDEATDLSVRTPGGGLGVRRLFYGNEWHWEYTRNNLHFVWDSLGQYIEIIEKGGVRYKRSGTGTSDPVFVSDTYRITRQETGYLWEDKSKNWMVFDAIGRMMSFGSRIGVLGKLLYGEDGRSSWALPTE